MSVTTVLFDLDGTLLPLNQDEFVIQYFKHLAAYLAPHGYDPELFTKAIYAGVRAMTENDGRDYNEAVFWEEFSRFFPQAREEMHLFDDFYANHFSKLQAFCSCNPRMRELIDRVKESGRTVVLATNPVFPATATEQRIRWAGLVPEDFVTYTTYDTSRFSKPSPEYYRELTKKLHVQPEECLMIGNDTLDDMVAESIGMKVFLLTDCLVNRKNKDVSAYPHGNMDQLLTYLEKIL
jgi:FMN phosphatase YigB (HAD superfamily)